MTETLEAYSAIKSSYDYEALAKHLNRFGDFAALIDGALIVNQPHESQVWEGLRIELDEDRERHLWAQGNGEVK